MTTILVIHRIALTRIVVNRKREFFLAGTLIGVGPMPGPHPAPAAQAASPPPGEGLGQAKGRKRTDIDSAPTVKWRSPQRPPGQRITRGRRNRWNTGGGNTRSAAARDSKREAAASPMTPQLSALWSVRLRGLSFAGERRRDGGTTGLCRTDSPDPRTHEQADPQSGSACSSKRFFFWTGRGPEGELPQRGKRCPSGESSF